MAKRPKLPKGFGSITEYKDKRYLRFRARSAQKVIDGKIIRKNLGFFKSYNAAYKALDEYNKLGYDLDLKGITLKEVYDRYIPSHIERNNIAKATVYSYTGAINDLRPLHNRPFADIVKSEIEGVLANITCSKSKKKKVTALLSLLYQYAQDDRLITHGMPNKIALGPVLDDAKGSIIISKDGEVESPDSRFISSKYRQNILAMEGDLVADILLFILHSGIRVGEIYGIRKSDVYLSKKYLIGGIKTEAGKNRIIPIHDFVLPVIKRHYKANKEFLFTNPNTNGPLTKGSYRHLFDEFRTKCDIGDHTSYDGRHTAITLLENVPDVPEFDIKYIVGHSQKGITRKVYTHPVIESLIKSINKIHPCGSRGDHLALVK